VSAPKAGHVNLHLWPINPVRLLMPKTLIGAHDALQTEGLSGNV
jgi:hypothetical protein